MENENENINIIDDEAVEDNTVESDTEEISRRTRSQAPPTNTWAPQVLAPSMLINGKLVPACTVCTKVPLKNDEQICWQCAENQRRKVRREEQRPLREVLKLEKFVKKQDINRQIYEHQANLAKTSLDNTLKNMSPSTLKSLEKDPIYGAKIKQYNQYISQQHSVPFAHFVPKPSGKPVPKPSGKPVPKIAPKTRAKSPSKSLVSSFGSLSMVPVGVQLENDKLELDEDLDVIENGKEEYSELDYS